MLPVGLVGIAAAASLWWVYSISREKALAEQTRLRLRPLPERAPSEPSASGVPA